MPTSKNTKPKEVSDTQTQPTAPAAKLTRSEDDRVICGVAAGIAEYLRIDPIIIRLLFVLLAISGGSGVLLYIILCFIMPEKKSAHKSTKEVITENSKNIESTIEEAAENIETAAKQRNTQTWIGFGIIILGVMFLLNNIGLLDFSYVVRTVVRSLWPLFIIGLGIVILTRSNNGK